MEFNTMIPDKEERKRIRADRIDKRYADSDKEKVGKGDINKDDEIIEKSRGQQQIADSLAHLDKKKSEGIRVVTDIRTNADLRESKRRIEEENQRQDRLHRLQEEAVKSGKQNSAVEMKWAVLLEQNMPQELHVEIEQQRAACEEIIQSKEALILEFNKQLKAKDEKYVKTLKQQAEDIEELLDRMRREFKELQEHYEVEIEAIENAFLQERSELLKSNKAEIDALFEKRRKKELIYMEQKQKREENYQKEIEELLVKDAEEYNKNKIKLETEIQTLEQQLEEMRATYQLNSEKLEYNYRVLKERDSENGDTLKGQKKKLTKLKDALSALVQKYHETDARDRKKNDELTEEYRRITKQYKDLQAKFRHFEISDNERFEQVWAMHEEEIKELVDKVLTADEIIHKQQLGWEWRPPNMELIHHPELEIDIYANTQGGDGTADTKEGDNTEEEEIKRKMVDGTKVKAVMELLASEAGFLVDARVAEALDSMPESEAELCAAESMLRALNVNDETDFAELISYFYQEKEPTSESENESQELPEALKNLQSIIQPDHVIKAIQSFVEDRKDAFNSRPKITMEGKDGADGINTGVSTRRNKETSAQKKEREFWMRMADVISEQHVLAWKHLEEALQKYNGLLKERAQKIENVTILQDQNAQLKSLLNQYLSDKVNEDLIIPPTDTIKLDPANGPSAH